ncbi:DeoR/GlpR family DNA-binding transcription regulator [Rossellomorea aquimaris]|uniref:DeoR/GlpR family DNA-binding transcription regulator n=1 Tax=Rossellomorea aquimaris TaxID=189382 RepID=UPI003CF9DBFB
MSLLAEERKKIIQSDLEEYGQVRVAELAEKFDVSTETIRRYLEELESEQKLKKVYGGAVKIEEDTGEHALYEREIVRINEKQKIADRALQFIEDNDVIIIDEGSTPLQMIKGLCAKHNITVITNSFPVASALISYSNHNQFDGEIVFIGGSVQPLHNRSGGSLTEKIAKEFWADKAFISADGLFHPKGVMSYDLEKSQLAQVYLRNATHTYLLADSMKIGVKATYRIAEFDQFDFIISDVDAPEEWEDAILKKKWVIG